MTHRDLEVWQTARDLSIAIHKMTMTELPKYELYEQGSQIRRSAKSVRANIVEGFGRRRHKQDYIRLLTYACASALETQDHLECLHETESLKNSSFFDQLHATADQLGAKLYRFIRSVEQHHRV